MVGVKFNPKSKGEETITPVRGVLTMIACATIVRGDRVLLVQHSDEGKPDYGHWLLPAGSVEHGESLDEAVKREVKEETGLRIRTVRKLTEVVDPYTKDKLVNFLCTTLTPSVETSCELKEAKWFGVDEINALTNIHPELKQFLVEGLTTREFSQ
ncbi:MAG: NUDIX domain-containing protein [Candidatus Bathyarchaeia archaeon]